MAQASAVAVAEGAEADPARERTGVQSIERAFSILSQIAQHQGISLAELSKKVGLHNSTTFHLVRTMVELGIVRQAKETKRYHLGRRIFSLAASSSSEVEFIATATPFLQELASATGESSHLGIRSGADVVIAAKVAGAGAFQLVERAGAVRPFHCTALGKVLMAGLPNADLRRYSTASPLAPSTPKSITDPELLWDEIMRVRETGLGYDDAEFDHEVRCVAAPVYDFRGQVVGAIGISGPVWRITLQRLQQLAAQVKLTAAEVSEELGYRRPGAAG